LAELNKIAIDQGLEDIQSLRQDTTVVETNSHYPTNNSILWDCIKEANRIPSHPKEDMEELQYMNYSVQAKKAYFKINNTKSNDKRTELFGKQLILCVKTINQLWLQHQGDDSLGGQRNSVKFKASMSIKETYGDCYVHSEVNSNIFAKTSRKIPAHVSRNS
jgi:hypothetical protein